MSERLILKGALEEKKMARVKLATQAEGLIRGLKVIIQHASVVPLKDLRTGEARELMVELDEVRSAYLKTCAEIEDIQRELG